MDNILLLIILGAVFGWIVGLLRRGALNLNIRLSWRTMAFLIGGLVIGITGSGFDGLSLFDRMLAAGGIISLVYLGWDFLQAKL